jgi:hypothetical protein
MTGLRKSSAMRSGFYASPASIPMNPACLREAQKADSGQRVVVTTPQVKREAFSRRPTISGTLSPSTLRAIPLAWATTRGRLSMRRRQFLPRPPASRSALNAFVKAAAYWLAAVTRGVAARYISILQGVYWIATQALPYIRAYLSPPKTLKELQQDVQNPETGYEIHHIVEQTPARDERFPESMIEGPDNLVRISTLKHRQISAWFQTKNDDFDGLSPRNYLRGKSWQERRRVGIDALIRFGVLKP